MKRIFLALFALFTSASLPAQDENLKYCGADEMRINTLKKDPKIAAAVVEREQALEKFTQTFTEDFYNHQTRSATYTIPVVFHVIHDFGPENISNAQILDGLDILNKTFRKQLADTGSIVAAFKPLHADCDIEFKLAQIDPDGNCTSGINRIPSYLTDIGDHQVKSLIHWPPNMYLNVYIVTDAAGLAGHCVWPSDADTIPGWDGIVIAHNYVGSIGTSNYTQSVAFAHECGHYLNLHHIWGGNNVPGFYYLPCGDTSNCSIGDDLVGDTPPTKGWQTCTLSGASCGNPVDNVQNTMDYSYCNRMFTHGQKARMQACLNSPIAGRNNLWTPANLAATGVALAPAPLCTADFTSNKQVVCETGPGNVISYTNTSYNGLLTAIEWTFSGGTPATSATANPTVTYNVPGVYDVKLKVSNGTDTVEVLKEKYVKVLPATGTEAYPYSEGFETVTSLHGNDWFLNNMDSENSWALVAVPFSGSWSVMLNNFDNTFGGKDELISPVIDLSGAAAMRISFRYAFAKKDPLTKDRLQLLVSNNCNTTWVQRLSLTDTVLATAPPEPGTWFTPADATEWKMASTSIPTAYLTDDFRFKFVHTAYGGNNLYLDDINIDVTASVDHLTEAAASFQVFPNPAHTQASLSFSLSYPETLEITLVDVLGKTVYRSGKKLYVQGDHKEEISVHHLSPGIYRIQLGNGLNSINKALVVR